MIANHLFHRGVETRRIDILRVFFFFFSLNVLVISVTRTFERNDLEKSKWETARERIEREQKAISDTLK